MSDNTPFPLDDDLHDAVGLGSYPEYSALWHLEKIGVLDNLHTAESAAWDAAQGDPVTVALIDTPVAWQNPNLYDAVDRARMIDFSVEDRGAFPVPIADLLLPEQQAARTAVTTAPDGINRSEAKTSSAVNPAFAAHGTAMAGLIGARPLDVVLTPGDSANDLLQKEDVLLHMPSNLEGRHSYREKLILPYAGANPFCKIVPISTSQTPNPEMLRNAFLYAQEIGAEVIVFATSLVPEHTKGVTPDQECGGHLPVPASGGALTDAWQQLENTILDIANTTYIVCAAGNTGIDQPVYPASLSHQRDKIIAVGALSEAGERVPYSTSNADVYVPSGDETQVDTEAFRVDPFAYDAAGLPGRPDAITQSNASYAQLISTDVPGPYGYNPSQYQWCPPAQGPHLEVASLFCEFSGTSGAAALAGGLIAMAIQKSPSRTANVTKKAAGDPPTLLTIDQL